MLGTLREPVAAFGAALMPPVRLPLSAWADKHARLSSEASARPGVWRTANYQREPLDAMGPNSPFHTVILEWAAQMGKTQMLLIALANTIAENPGPVMIIEPTLAMAEAISKDRIAPMFRDTPVLEGKVSHAKAKDSGSTILHRQFERGHVTLVGANSPSSLASRPIRDVHADEVDRYESTREGDPLELARVRQETFWNRKLIATSTPTVKGASKIHELFLESDQRFYLVPCPHCNYFQRLTWGRIEWPEGRPDLAELRCEKCERLIPHAEKADMVNRGQWQPANPDAKPGVYGSHMSRLYSPWRSWADLATHWRSVHGDPERLRVFINTALAELWDDEAQAKVNEAELLERREAIGPMVPDQAAILTAGVDVQDDRFEVLVYAWGAGEESWLMEHRVIPGDLGQPAIWQALDAYLSHSWQHPTIGAMALTAVCIDSGGHYTAQVCKFADERRGRRIWAIKGQGGAGHRVWPVRQSKAVKGKVYLVGVDSLKQTLLGRLRIREAGPGFVHFPQTATLGFFEQMLSEYVATEYRRGVPVRTWQRRKGRKAEAWDGSVYALGAIYGLQSFGVHVDTEVERVKAIAEINRVGMQTQQQQQAAKPASWRSGWFKS